MRDSHYYYNQVIFYNNLIGVAKKEKKALEKLKANLKKIEGCLPNVQSNLNCAKNHYLEKGYIDIEETFDRGKIKETCNDIDFVLASIRTFIAKSDDRIYKLENNIKNYKNNYDIAQKNYALRSIETSEE